MYDTGPALSNHVSLCAATLKVRRAPSDRAFEMLWVFQPNGERMQCEIHRDGDGAGYETIVTHAGGSQRMERFGETGGLIKRTLEFQRELMEAGWRQPK